MQTRVCRLYAQGDIRIETEDVAVPDPGEVLVAVAAGGICGSDLHYFRHGGFGPIRVKEPIILGHEASGRVAAVGPGVEGLAIGQPVAISPSRPCNDCMYCNEGLPIHCLNMRFSGSALRFPHEQGLFRDKVIVGAVQCVPVAEGTAMDAAACAEPLAVCLHAAVMAGDLSGRRVLVTGAGPIGSLCAGVAAMHGASEIVVTDLQDFVLGTAAAMGATRTINTAQDPDALAPFAENKGHFDVVFECSGAAPALATAISVLRPRGVLVQVGISGDTPVPLNLIVGKELTIRGTHRFHEEFAAAVDAISKGAIDVTPVISTRFPLEDAVRAFETASDRTRAAKVQLAFEGA